MLAANKVKIGAGSEKKNEQERRQRNFWWAHTTFPS